MEIKSARRKREVELGQGAKGGGGPEAHAAFRNAGPAGFRAFPAGPWRRAEFFARHAPIRASYQAAQTPAYLPLLEKRKLTGAILAARLADAESLERLDGQFKAADNGAATATATRDEAGEKMSTWIKKFRRQAKSDLRRHPNSSPSSACNPVPRPAGSAVNPRGALAD